MSDESLSENQVESLIKAMESVDGGPAKVRGTAGAAEDQNSPSHSSVTPAGTAQIDAKVTTYDFKRPKRVGVDQMRAMHSLHETLARNFGAAISGMLRTMIEVKLTNVDQLTYSEFVFSLNNPSCFNVLRADPLEGNWILDIAPSLSYAIIDRMLGGDPEPDDSIRRPLTEIETRLIGRVVQEFLTRLTEAWENITPLDLAIESVQSNPQLVQIVPPNEVVILVAFEMLFGKNRGMLNLCIPFNTIENYNSKLSGNGWVGYGKATPTEETRQRVSSSVDSAPVDVVVTLARSKIRTADLLDLSVGDIITTEKETQEPLELAVQDVPKFHAKPGAFKGRKAVRIESILENPTQRK
ncbi:MAG: flagellar motor switch protein FliM [Planctomycetota bacterium]|nr:flagellar motor switch protein FliM [Planctomycetota bacterium]